jgi:hypothetical protein
MFVPARSAAGRCTLSADERSTFTCITWASAVFWTCQTAHAVAMRHHRQCGVGHGSLQWSRLADEMHSVRCAHMRAVYIGLTTEETELALVQIADKNMHSEPPMLQGTSRIRLSCTQGQAAGTRPLRSGRIRVVTTGAIVDLDRSAARWPTRARIRERRALLLG